MVAYDRHHELQAYLEQQEKILPSRSLHNFESRAVYAAMLDRLAQPLPDGRESPFSSRSPLSAHGQIMSQFTYLLDLQAHEINLIPDYVWYQVFRMMGAQPGLAEYPLIRLRFQRASYAIGSQRPTSVPMGTKIRSMYNPRLEVLTTRPLVIGEVDRNESSGQVVARLNVKGKIDPNIPLDGFTVYPQHLSNIDSVIGTEILYEGKEAETLVDTMLRVRRQLRVGRRLVTAPDFYDTIKDMGARAVKILPNRRYGDPNNTYSDRMTCIVYPGTLADVIRDKIQRRVMADTIVDIQPAEIIPIDGVIDAKIISNLTDIEARDIAARAIVNYVNPPNGKWGDTNLKDTIRTALERQQNSIYGVASMQLREAYTGTPLEDLNPQPWQLFEIRNSVQFNWIR